MIRNYFAIILINFGEIKKIFFFLFSKEANEQKQKSLKYLSTERENCDSPVIEIRLEFSFQCFLFYPLTSNENYNFWVIERPVSDPQFHPE